MQRLPFYFPNKRARQFAAGLLVVLIESTAFCAQAAPPEALPDALPPPPPTPTPPSPGTSAVQASNHCRNNLQSPIINFCEVAPNTLWRGAKPDEEGAAWLVAHGVRTVVNLELMHDDLANFGAAKNVDPNAPPIKIDIQYFRLRDWEPLAIFVPALTDQHVVQFLAIMKQSPKPVYVHCRSGQNRTGVMVAAYRLLIENADLEKTIAEMKHYHGFWSFADSRYLRDLVKRRDAVLRQADMNTPKRDATISCSDSICKIEPLDP